MSDSLLQFDSSGHWTPASWAFSLRAEGYPFHVPSRGGERVFQGLHSLLRVCCFSLGQFRPSLGGVGMHLAWQWEHERSLLFFSLETIPLLGRWPLPHRGRLKSRRSRSGPKTFPIQAFVFKRQAWVLTLKAEKGWHFLGIPWVCFFEQH